MLRQEQTARSLQEKLKPSASKFSPPHDPLEGLVSYRLLDLVKDLRFAKNNPVKELSEISACEAKVKKTRLRNLPRVRACDTIAPEMTLSTLA